MAKIDFTKSANEGHYIFCGIFNIELDDKDLKKISEGHSLRVNLVNEEANYDFIFFIKRRVKK